MNNSQEKNHSLNEMTETKNELNNKNNEIMKELNQLKYDISENQKERDVLINEINRLNNEVNELKVEVTNKAIEITDLKNEIIDRKNEISQLKYDILSIKQENTDSMNEYLNQKKDNFDLKTEINKLKNEIIDLKNDLALSDDKITSHSENIMKLLDENTKLNKLCQDHLISLETFKKEKNERETLHKKEKYEIEANFKKEKNELERAHTKEKSELETTYKTLTETHEKILKGTNTFEQKIDEIEQSYDKLTEQYLLVCAENERIHEILEGYTPEVDSHTSLYISKLENDKLLLENEIDKWKLEYNDLKYLMQTNEDLVMKNQELNNTVNNLYFSQSIEGDKYQKVISELVEKIKFLSAENDRLNNIILTRCKDMMNTW